MGETSYGAMKSKHPERAFDVVEKVILVCECGNHGTTNIRHWERVKCVCGRIWWALRPKRHGALKLFPWPGNGYMPTGWEQ